MPADTDKIADLAVARQRQRQVEAQSKAEADSATHHTIALSVRAHLAHADHEPVFANGAFFVPSKSGLWEAMSHERMQVLVAELHGGKKLCRKHSDFKQIVEHLAALCAAEGFFNEAALGVASPDGLHRLTDDGHVECVPLSLAHRQTFRLPHAPDYEAEAPLFDAVLAQAFEGDDAEAQTDLFWRAFGASLLGLLAMLQLVMLLLGRERSGKSLVQRVLERAFPVEAICAVSPASWGNEYYVAALAGKRINVVGELSDEAPIPAAAFKNVTGQNLVACRHPTHRPFTERIHAAHWFASNVLPPTTDRTEAFYRRWRVLRFANTVPAERVDPGLFDKIVATEMPAILASALLGAERVAQSGGLPTTSAHAAVLDRWRLAANPLQQFLTDTEWVEIDPDAAEHTTPAVYEAYRRWSASCGFRNPFGRNHFLELLDATGAARGVTLKRSGTKNVVAGLRLVPREFP